MVGERVEGLASDLSVVQHKSMGVSYPNFRALEDSPWYLGMNTHGRLEALFSSPIGSSDPEADKSDERIGQRSGAALGDLVGRNTEFVTNLPSITANVQSVATERGVSEDAVWEEVTSILRDSGIGQEMQRTLDAPIEGGAKGLHEFIEKNSESGIVVVSRENIANWAARRHVGVMGLLGAMSNKALSNVKHIVYAGSGRQYGEAELWRPELQEYVTQTPDGKLTSNLTEAKAAELHAAETRDWLNRLALNTPVHSVGAPNTAEGRPAIGDDVMRSVIGEIGPDTLRDSLIIEVGNAPAGYTQLVAALVLAQELGPDFDPTRQWVGVSDAITVINPTRYNALTIAQKSEFQNAATALNPINGSLDAVVKVNRYMNER